MITYICGSMIKYSQFPNEFLKELDALMKDGDEILLGDSDFDHSVYGRFTNKQYRNVSVIEEGPVRKRWFYTRIESFLNSCISMVKKSDRMIAVWDGESPDAYINILLLLSLHKTCRMYYLPSGKCIEIKSVDDLVPYVPERQGWTKDDIEEVLRTCGFEDQMVAHMLDNFGFSEKFLTEIIGRAPIPIKKKLELMENLLKNNNLKYETFTKVAELIRADADVDPVKQTIQETYDLFGSNLSNCISAIHSAENGMKYGMYYLFSEWYDLDVFFEKSYPIGMFDTFKKAIECIKREEKYEQDGVEDDGDEENLNEDWWKIEAWYCDVFDKDYEHTYNYYIYKDEVCWFECLHKEMHDFGVVSYLPVNNDFFGDLVDLNFDTPFKCGDIVRVDCRPFGPPFNALIRLSNVPSMSVGKLIEVLGSSYCTVINNMLPLKTMPSVMLWGPPGVGKSQAVRQIASVIEDSTGKKVNVTDVRLLLFNPIDLRGIPTSNADKTLAVWLKPQIFQMDDSPDVVNILFLDEISAAPQSVQAAAYQITLDRTVGEHRLPDNCIVIAAGNRVTDKSVAFKMPKALANRLMHIEVEGSFDAWKKWAITSGINDKVIGFLSFRSNYLMGFEGSTDDLAFATPRSWEMVSNILNGIDNSIEKMYPLIAGLIGSGAAIEFRTWEKVYKDLPSIEDIFAGKMPKVPRSMDALYALTSSMTVYARNHKNDMTAIGNSIKYSDTMPPDFSVVLLKDYMYIEPGFREKLMMVPEFVKWMQSKGKLLNGSVK